MDFLTSLDPNVVALVLEAALKAVEGLQGWHYAAIASAVLTGGLYAVRKYQASKKPPADVIPFNPKA